VPFLTGKTVLIWYVSPSPRGQKPNGEGLHRVPPARPPWGFACSALARGYRDEGEDDHPLGLDVADAPERGDGLDEREGRVEATARWGGWEVDDGRAGQVRVGDG
jgi:hypothetical protein